jgi:PDZ domain
MQEVLRREPASSPRLRKTAEIGRNRHFGGRDGICTCNDRCRYRVNSTQLDESYDMIIGIDGYRIMTLADFEEHLCPVRAGEIVYLNVLRNGLRLQVPVVIPSDTATPYCASISTISH